MTAYAHGYIAEMVDLLSRRSATSDAAFFVPALKPGMRLLDCGCGPGTITISLARVVAPGEVIGIELDAGQVAVARGNAEKAGAANVRFQVGDACSLPFSDAEFDAVFAHTLLQHLPDPLRGVKEMHRVLRSPGVLGVREEDWGGTFFFPTTPILDRSIDIFLKDWLATGGDPYLPRRYRTLLREAGFDHVKTSASAVARETEEAAKFSELAATILLAPATRKRVIDAGLASDELLQAIQHEWLAWGRNPDAFWNFTYGEAIGLKSAPQSRVETR